MSMRLESHNAIILSSQCPRPRGPVSPARSDYGLNPFVEHFPMLDASGVCRSAFITRIPGIDVSADKTEALRRLDAAHLAIRREMDLANFPLITAEQIHG